MNQIHSKQQSCDAFVYYTVHSGRETKQMPKINDFLSQHLNLLFRAGGIKIGGTAIRPMQYTKIKFLMNRILKSFSMSFRQVLASNRR